MKEFLPQQPLLPLRGGTVATPLGSMVAVVDADGALVRLAFVDHRDPEGAWTTRSWHGWEVGWETSAVGHVAVQLEEYFAHSRRRFELALAPLGGDFYQRVWGELRTIPYGATVTYGKLAEHVGRPRAARAVGRANAVNPISIVVPCHRVIGADGRLTGYGGGIDRKAALLAHEGIRR